MGEALYKWEVIMEGLKSWLVLLQSSMMMKELLNIAGDISLSLE